MNNKFILFVSFLFGLGSNLFFQTPFGYIALLDLTCFFLGPILFVTGYSKFTKEEKKILFLGALWLFGSCYSNLWRQEPFDSSLKGNMIVFNAICMIVVFIWLFKRTHETFLWFVVGAGISAVLSMHVMQSASFLLTAERASIMGIDSFGSYVADKLIFPLYVVCIYTSILFPLKHYLKRALPWSAIAVFCFAAGLFLLMHVGSRANFGIYMFVGMFVLAYAYFPSLIYFCLKNILFLVLMGGLLSVLVFSGYR
ncbi:MAG: hypothetical protein PHE03_10420, partial [Bacteroidales bacterium]|nr:hypothetical protein [Bacteroidales bacterium]